MKKTVKRLRIFLPVLAAALCLCSCGAKNGDKWFEKYNIVTHALGTSGAEPYNCLEGFNWSYLRGQKVFECDLVKTTDGRLVLSHGFDEEYKGDIPDYDRFMNTPIEGGYTPLSLEDVLRLMQEHEDIRLVTDFKEEDDDRCLEQICLMADIVRNGGYESLFPRIIVQFYREEDLDTIRRAGDFGGYIFTLYKRGFDKSQEEFEKIASFCRDEGVDVIVMKKGKWKSSFAPIAKKYGVKVYTHTVYTAWQEELMIRSGADGAYCDSISLSDAERIAQLARHWYDSDERLWEIDSPVDAASLYDQGRRAFFYRDMDAGDAAGAVDFLREHPDAFIGYDYSEDLTMALSGAAMPGEDTVSYNRSPATEEGDEIMARTIAVTDSFNIFNKELKRHLFWCDVIYDAGDVTDVSSLDRIMDKALEKGIACVAVESSLRDDEYRELAGEYDVRLYFRP